VRIADLRNVRSSILLRMFGSAVYSNGKGSKVSWPDVSLGGSPQSTTSTTRLILKTLKENMAFGVVLKTGKLKYFLVRSLIKLSCYWSRPIKIT
jgi:hypothetical protein